MELYTDACLYGLAAIFQKNFYQARTLPTECAELHCYVATATAYDLYVPIEYVININVLELIVI